MSNNRNNTRTANDTASRVEVDAVSTTDAATVDTFRTAALSRATSRFAEARDYVASVDARGGKRGADAAVQRVIAEGLSGLTDSEGHPVAVEPYSHARYSKMSAAFRAIAVAGFIVATAGAFDALYALWNVSSSRLSAADRDTFVAGLKRRKSDAARVAAILSHVASLSGKSERAPKDDAPADDTADDTADTASDAPAATPTDAASIVDMLASIAAMLPTLSDDARIRIADAAQDLADAAHALTVPADASTLTAA